MTKGIVRTDAKAYLKVLMASALVVTQCITVTPGIRGQAQNQPSVDLPSLVGKSMGDIIQQFKSSKKYCREVTKDLLARMPPDVPYLDDLCQFKNGNGLLSVFTYRGRAAGFTYVFRLNKVPTDPEEALLRVGINVNGVKPQIQEDPPGVVRYYVWSGIFSEKSWKEVKVMQLLKNRNRCDFVLAIPSDKAE